MGSGRRNRSSRKASSLNPMFILPEIGKGLRTEDEVSEDDQFLEERFDEPMYVPVARTLRFIPTPIPEKGWGRRAVAATLLVIILGGLSMTVKAWRADHWVLSAQNAETAIDANRMGEARGYVNEVMEQSDTSAVAFELEARRAARDGDPRMAAAAARAGARYSNHWRSDLMLSRVLAQNGDHVGAAALAEAAFVRGAPPQYSDEIAKRQRQAGRGKIADRIMEYKKSAARTDWPIKP